MTEFPAQITRIGNVGTHKMCRLWVEIPQERAMAFIARFGWATEEKPIPVTISQEGEAKRESTSHEKVLDSLEIVPAGVHNPYSRRAGILACDKMFQTWIDAPLVDAGTFAAAYIRKHCQVTSRKDILPGTDAALRFDLLQSAFVVWREGPKHGAA